MITLIHTAQSHIPRFDAVALEIGLDVSLRHVVREDWLARAQGVGDPALGPEIIETLQGIGGRMLCTCTTIAPWAETAGALRVDRPMAEAAARIGGRCLMVYCLDSTRDVSLGILENSFSAIGRRAEIETLNLSALWPVFERGGETGFAKEIAAAVDNAVSAHPALASVVLAQASMSEAVEHVRCNVPVLASPQIALEALNR